MPQLLETTKPIARPVFPYPTAPKVFTHIVVLLNRKTGHEVELTIETFTDRFTDVLREITWQRAERKLQGYEIWETLDCNDPFPA